MSTLKLYYLGLFILSFGSGLAQDCNNGFLNGVALFIILIGGGIIIHIVVKYLVENQ
jgi:hypothetical protein